MLLLLVVAVVLLRVRGVLAHDAADPVLVFSC
jgi:hypothetical protein